MHLIEEMKNDRDAFIVHAEIVAKIAYELRAGDIHVGEGRLTIRL
jgi:hypothetical protein